MKTARSLRLATILPVTALAIILGVFACPGGGGKHSRPATLSSIAVTPSNPTVALGTSQQFTATGTYSDGTTRDLTALVAWDSTDAAAGSVSNVSGSQGLATGLGTGSTTISAALSGISGSTTLTVSSAVLVSMEVTPTNPQIALGTSQQFTATGKFSDGTTQDLTAQVVWDSSAVGTATVSVDPGSQGLAASAGLGDATITATLSGVSGSTTLTVTSAVLVSIEVTPTTPQIALGTSQQLAATGTFSDATVQDLTSAVIWSSSGLAVLVSNTPGSNGFASGVQLGTTTITATFGAISGSTSMTVSSAALVSLEVTPTSPVIALGTAQTFAATGTFTDGTIQDLTEQVTWTSSAETFASVSNADGSRGIATSVAIGNTTITATFSGISGSTTLSVSNATLVSIEVTPSLASIALGTTQLLVATGTYTDNSTQNLTNEVTWASSDEAIATVSNADGSRGLATSVSVGTTTISAALSGVTGSTGFVVSSAALVSIGISPDASDLAKGTSEYYSAIGVLTDGTHEDLTDQVTWASSDDAVATISNAAGSHGYVTCVGVGSTTISATHSGISGSTSLNVTNATLVSIDIAPFLQSAAKGTQVQFAALGNYSDSTTQDLTSFVTWSSSDGAVAAISNAAGSHGLVTALAVGTTTISAGLSGIVGAADLDVTPAVLDSITVEPSNASVPLGLSVTFTATGVFSDASTQDVTKLVTWSSSDPAVATVSNVATSEGFATGLAGGSTTITATYAGKSATTTLTVTSATLVSITISPADPILPAQFSIRLEATGNYSDGSTTALTGLVVWSSSNTNVATISNAVGTEGRAYGVSVGTATLSATRGGVTSSTIFTVTNETLNSITVEPDTLTLGVGESIQMTATGYFSGGTILDVTSQLKWTVVPRSIATIGNTTATKGIVTVRRTGNATIRASKGNKNGTASLSAN